MPLRGRRKLTPLEKFQAALIFLIAGLLGYYIFTDDFFALLVGLILLAVATTVFIRNVLKGKPFWKSLKKWLGEVWDFLHGIG